MTNIGEKETEKLINDERKELLGDSTSIGDGLQACGYSAGRCFKNLIAISFSFFLFFVALGSLTKLMSTMNGERGIGPDSQAVVYFCSMLSCFFPQLMVEKFGAKSTYIVALLVSCLHIAANFYLRWDVMMAGAVLYGIACGPLKISMSFYLDEMARRFEACVDENHESVKALFFGLHVFFAEITSVVGNGISYAVLKEGRNASYGDNSTFYNDCGAYFSPQDHDANNTNLSPPSQYERNLLTGIYVLFSVSAVLVACFLDPLKNDVKDVRGCERVSKTFFGAVTHLKNPHQVLLIPLSVFCGIQCVFYSNEITEGRTGHQTVERTPDGPRGPVPQTVLDWAATGKAAKQYVRGSISILYVER